RWRLAFNRRRRGNCACIRANRSGFSRRTRRKVRLQVLRTADVSLAIVTAHPDASWGYRARSSGYEALEFSNREHFGCAGQTGTRVLTAERTSKRVRRSACDGVKGRATVRIRREGMAKKGGR